MMIGQWIAGLLLVTPAVGVFAVLLQRCTVNTLESPYRAG